MDMRTDRTFAFANCWTLLTCLGFSACGGNAIDRAVAAYNRLLSCQALPDTTPAGLLRFNEEQIRTTLNQLTALKGSGFTTDQINACAAAMEQVSCDQFTAGNVPFNSDACNPHGSLADGSACSNNSQCQSGQCLATSGIQCGSCAHVQSTGQPCGGANPGCGTGLICLNSTCVALGGAGSSCGQAGLPSCKSGLLCVSGKCAQPIVGKEGSSCGDSTGVNCGAGLGCIQGACTALRSSGQSCDGILSECAAFSNCDVTTKLCTALKAARLGEACGASNKSTQCVEGYCAASGKCETLLSAGQACTSSNSCESSATCANMVCTTRPTCP